MCVICSNSWATHNRSGSITYVHLFGTTYEFTITTCTKTSSDADRPELEIDWGDFSVDTIPRIDTIFGPNDTQKNIYKGIHTYTGPNTYIISVEDPNRNAGVLNISNSVDKVFCIQTELVISPFIGAANNSLIIEDCPCPEFACLDKLYCYNLSAYDPDGDSLSYSLVPCRGEGCLEMNIPEIYNYPQDIGGGTLTIDSITGTLCWDYPQIAGEYNIAIKISEWRNGFYVGSVVEDMQITVKPCNNDAPIIIDVADTCVYAGTSVDIAFVAYDPGDVITVYGTGAVFHLSNNPAIFIDSVALDTAVGHFIWTPDCSQVSNSYYSIIVHAEDNDPVVQLTDLSTFRIKIIAPPVQNLTVIPTGSSMTLTWSSNICAVSYNIYRSLDSSLVNDICCDPGSAGTMGYSLIGSTGDTTFIDSGVLIVGNEYCYMVTAVTINGVESCVSDQICEHLNFEIPVMTHVSIVTTSSTIGTDTVYWSYPKELNTVLYPGPYHYQLYRQDNYGGGAETLVLTTVSQVSIINPDTVFSDSDLNTFGIPYTYRVELFNNGLLIGGSVPASSIYLVTTPNDNEIALTWQENIPWNNNSYEIYRETTPGSTVFNLIGTTNSIGYIDTGLVNGVEYCYKIKTIGKYSAPGIVDPIENWSQEVCDFPIDLTAPCPPVLTIDGDCDLEETYLSWTNPNNSCADDVMTYNLYFAAFEGDSIEFLTSFSSQFDTSFVHKDRGSIAGCYYVTAIDSVQYNNESEPSNIACIDNCDGYYVLPNVFTPDGDQINDFFHPLLPFKFVERIELVIVNRWGEVVFETIDPFINWDGTHQTRNKKCNDGVYFFNIIVYEIKLEGLVPRAFQGNIQILGSK